MRDDIRLCDDGEASVCRLVPRRRGVDIPVDILVSIYLNLINFYFGLSIVFSFFFGYVAVYDYTREFSPYSEISINACFTPGGFRNGRSTAKSDTVSILISFTCPACKLLLSWRNYAIFCEKYLVRSALIN